MNSLNKILRLIFSVTVIFLVTGCSSSKLINSWKDPELKPAQLKNVFVICVNNNNTKRREWEDAVVNSLKSNGVKAHPSYKDFPKDIPDSSNLSSYLGNKFDAVLMVHKVNEEIRKYRTPGFATIYPVVAIHGHFFHSYSRIYREVYVPGRIEKEKVYQLETSVYEPSEDGRLIWSAVTETRSPSSTKEFSRDVLEVLIPNMRAFGIIPGQK